ncbi:hypothetical protein [Tenacibaculum singaporense]|uniref:hypothetical protein n=1 Tax=Tenacibaculum singaporense TaxID=2358479 RepID=UPI000F67B694|nr:hypothetical protein [Tenacibaculum singaporense]RSC93304.1 hypothetical protein EI424_08725 [Tenacibaculum singaporense]
MKEVYNKASYKNSILGEFHEEFTENKKVSSPRLNINEINKEEIPDLFKNYDYEVCSWPIIIDSYKSSLLEELTFKIPKLISKIPELYFKNDIKKIADYYYEGNQIMAQLGLISLQMNQNSSIRLDLSLPETDFKVLEVNAGSLLGGFELSSFESTLRDLHPSFLNFPREKFKSYNVQQKYFQFLINEVLNYTGEKNEVNIFIGLTDKEDSVRQNAMKFINGLVKKEFTKLKIKGKAYTGDVSELKNENGAVTYRGIPIHGITLLGKNIPLDKTIYRSFIQKKVYLTTHFGYAILGDKRSLVLLRKLALQNCFSKEENELILRSIPFTESLSEKITVFKGKEYDVLELVKKQKNNFVIKDAVGAQGDNVFIGEFETKKSWNEIINLGLEKNYIIQEYCASKNYLAPNKNNLWVDHKLIWGAFGFGEEYGGVWGRLSETINDVGVINSAKGAVEAIIFEYN